MSLQNLLLCEFIKLSQQKHNIRLSKLIELYYVVFSRRYSRYYTLHRFDGDSSPGSSTSVSSSPPNTPPLLYYDSTMEDDIGDDNYSPVYNDTEWGDDEGKILLLTHASSKSC